MSLTLWIFVISLSSSCVNGSPDTSRSARLINATNCFSTNLTPKLKSDDGNLISSALSVNVVLSMIQMGANGSTYNELNKALLYQDNGLSNEDVQDEVESVLKSLNNLTDVTLSIENSLWVQKDYPIKSTYKEIVREKFLAKEDNLDFLHNAHGATDTINQWVNEETNSLIPKLFNYDDLSSDSILVLVNAIYFRGKWNQPFVVSDTKTRPFLNNNDRNQKKMVSLMNQQATFPYHKDKTLQAKVLEMSYKGDVTKFVAVLPNEKVSLSEVEAKLDCLKLSEVLKKTTMKPVDVTIPKLDITSSLDLEQPLRTLGVNAVFGEGAGLSGIADGKLKVTKILQKARIKVFEEGSEAAAATGVDFEVEEYVEEPEYEEFNANRPFLFYIMHCKSGEILFSGRVVNL